MEWKPEIELANVNDVASIQITDFTLSSFLHFWMGLDHVNDSRRLVGGIEATAKVHEIVIRQWQLAVGNVVPFKLRVRLEGQERVIKGEAKFLSMREEAYLYDPAPVAVELDVVDGTFVGR